MSVMVGTYLPLRLSAPWKKSRSSFWNDATSLRTSGLSTSNDDALVGVFSDVLAATTGGCAGAALVIACFTLGLALKQPLISIARSAARAARRARHAAIGTF